MAIHRNTFFFLPTSCSELVSSLNPFYPKCVPQHRTLALPRSLLEMQNLRQYSRNTTSKFEHLQDIQTIQRPFKMWVLSLKARKRNKVRNSTWLCHLLLAFACWNWKSAQIYKVVFYIDNLGYIDPYNILYIFQK